MASSTGSGDYYHHKGRSPVDIQTTTHEQVRSQPTLDINHTASLQGRLCFHDKLHKQSKCDLETPASVIANVNIKQLLTPAAFACLPATYQNELIKLLPDADRIHSNDNETPLAMTVTALSNEFFAKSCVEYRDRLRNGEFCMSTTTNSRADVDLVVWECDATVLKERPPRLDIPKAGEPFICTSKYPPSAKKERIARKVPPSEPIPAKKPEVVKLKKPTLPITEAKTTSLLKSSKSFTPSTTKAINISQSEALAQKVVSKAKAVSNLNSKQKAILAQTIMAGVKRPRTETQPYKPTTRPSTESSQSSPRSNQVTLTKFKKVTENGVFGGRVTKVVPIVVRNPHGQVVTTLANCNPLLTQMIKNPVKVQTATTPPVKVEKKQSLLPTILKRNNPVIVTLRNNPRITTTRNGVNKVVTEVISKVKMPTEQTIAQHVGNVVSQSGVKPVIVTVNGSNGTIASRYISTAVNIERSKEICDSSKNSAPTLNLERSYQICKQVLGKTEGAATIVVIGPGGKKKLISKPVRSRLADATSGSNNSSHCSSDIPMYRNKHRGSGKSTLTLSGHVFLAIKSDEDGYAAKAYKRKTAFKQRLKKKSNKVGGKKTMNALTSPSSVCTAIGTIQSSVASITAGISPPTSTSNLTMVTDTKHATQPVLSISEVSPKALSYVSSLLNSCMCSKRALIICRKCGAFCHAECTSDDHCLACLIKEK